MSPNEQCHFKLALIKVRQIQNRWSGCVPGVAARQRVPHPGRMQGLAQPPLGPWAQGQRGWRVLRGPAASTGPQIPEERRGGRAGRGSQLEDEQLSESSQSTLTR